MRENYKKQIENKENWVKNDMSLGTMGGMQMMDQINFLKAEQGQRIMFFPLAPKVYSAFILKNWDQQVSQFLDKGGKGSSTSQAAAAIQRIKMKNNMFLDMESLDIRVKTVL